MNPFFIGVPIMLFGWFTAFFIRESSLRFLSLEQKGMLVERFSTMRSNMMFVMIGIFMLFLVFRFLLPVPGTVTFLSFLTLIYGMTLGFDIRSFAKMRTMNLPDSFIRRYRLARIFTHIGYLGLWGAMACTPFVTLD